MKKREKIDKYLIFVRKLWNKNVSVILIGVWCAWNIPRALGKETGRIGNQKKNQDHINYNSVKLN